MSRPHFRNRSFNLILASQSPRRRQLLKQLGIPFQMIPSHLHEPRPGKESAAAYAKKLALAKAVAVAQKLKADSRFQGNDAQRWVLGADTIVVSKGKILGKPANPAQARRFLNRLQGTTHQVITALALVNIATGKRRVAHTSSQVTMRRLSEEEIRRYSYKHLDKAGAYAVQEKKDPVVSQIRGSYTNVVGLPTELLRKLLQRSTADQSDFSYRATSG